MAPNKDEIITCTVESLAQDGRGVAHVDGLAVFVDGGLPGDVVRARITRMRQRLAEAVVLAVETPSPHRVAPRCRHFGQCGGCALQDLDYGEQLAQKGRQVADALRRLGGVDPGTVAPTAGSLHVWRYRNKMEFAFESRKDGLSLGLRARANQGRPGRVLDLTECHICSERTVEILGEARKFCRATRVAAYDPASRKGFWRHLVVRHTGFGQVMVHLITSAWEPQYKKARQLLAHLAEKFPDTASLVHSIRRSRQTLAFGEEVVHRVGPPHVEERLDHVRYRLSPNSFFQTNTAGAVRLYRTVAEVGGFKPRDRVLDLYCGAGGIGLYLADRVAEVHGFELSEETVAAAEANARLNQLTNCRFTAGSLEQGVPELAGIERPDVVVSDPPRSGMHEPVAEAVLALAPERVVMVSCDPGTLARDVGLLASKYEVATVRPVDLFPHTPHVEAVVGLRLK